MFEGTRVRRYVGAARRWSQGRRDWHELDAYMPYSAGRFSDLQDLALGAVARTPALMVDVAESVGAPLAPVVSTADFWSEHGAPDVDLLRERFIHYGSDKSSRHDYEYVYSAVLGDPDDVKGVLEVGLGTNHEDVLSHMGAAGKPGASLRAFRDYLPSAQVYGADIDRRILFEEDRIRTFWVDQLDQDAVKNLGSAIPGKLDLLIDDGLHSPDANLEILKLGLDKVRPGGWIVVEDIKPSAEALWRVVGALLAGYESYLVRSAVALVFCVRQKQ